MSFNRALNVSVGAYEHKSLGKTFKSVLKSTNKMGDAYRDTNKKLKAADSVIKYRSALEELRRKQAEAGGDSEKFAARIKRAQASLTNAERNAKQYGLSLKGITHEQEKLSKESKKYETILKRRKKLFEVGSSLKSGVGKVGGAVGMVGMAGAGVIGAGLAAVTMANRETAQNDAQARAIGVNPETIQALGGVVKGLGFEAENVVDLFEELNNKMGESAGIEEVTAVTDALKILGLEYDHLAALKPEQQFLAIARAAQKLGDAQQASAAADILMGGEANKIIGDLVRRGVSIDALIDKQKSLSVLTAEGRAGAQQFNVALNELQTAGGSALQEISGIIGSELSPIISTWAADLVSFFRENREQIVAFIQGTGDFFKELPGQLAKAAEVVGKIVAALSKVAGWILGDDDEEKEKPSPKPKRKGYAYGYGYGGYQNTMASGNRYGQILDTARRQQATQQNITNASTASSSSSATVQITVNNADGLDETKLANLAASEVDKALARQRVAAGIQSRGSMTDDY